MERILLTVLLAGVAATTLDVRLHPDEDPSKFLDQYNVVMDVARAK